MRAKDFDKRWNIFIENAFLEDTPSPLDDEGGETERPNKRGAFSKVKDKINQKGAERTGKKNVEMLQSRMMKRFDEFAKSANIQANSPHFVLRLANYIVDKNTELGGLNVGEAASAVVRAVGRISAKDTAKSMQNQGQDQGSSEDDILGEEVVDLDADDESNLDELFKIAVNAGAFIDNWEKTFLGVDYSRDDDEGEKDEEDDDNEFDDLSEKLKNLLKQQITNVVNLVDNPEQAEKVTEELAELLDEILEHLASDDEEDNNLEEDNIVNMLAKLREENFRNYLDDVVGFLRYVYQKLGGDVNDLPSPPKDDPNAGKEETQEVNHEEQIQNFIDKIKNARQSNNKKELRDLQNKWTEYKKKYKLPQNAAKHNIPQNLLTNIRSLGLTEDETSDVDAEAGEKLARKIFGDKYNQPIFERSRIVEFVKDSLNQSIKSGSQIVQAVKQNIRGGDGSSAASAQSADAMSKLDFNEIENIVVRNGGRKINQVPFKYEHMSTIINEIRKKTNISEDEQKGLDLSISPYKEYLLYGTQLYITLQKVLKKDVAETPQLLRSVIPQQFYSQFKKFVPLIDNADIRTVKDSDRLNEEQKLIMAFIGAALVGQKQG